MRKNLAHFVATQHYRQPHWFLGSLHRVEPSDLLLKHFLIEKEQGAQRLVLRRCGYISVPCQMCQKFSYLSLRHVVRVSLVVEKNKAPDPVGISSLCAQTEMFPPDHVPDLV